MDNRGVDTDPGWVNRKIRELERQIQDLRSERRASATTIGSGGLVVDGGEILLLDDDGSVLFRVGPQQYGDRGVSIFRESGLAAVEVTKGAPGLPQAVRIRDSSGNEIVSEWAFGNGLARPLMSMPAYPVAAPAAYGVHGPEVTTVSGSFVTLWSMRTTQQNALWNPRLQVKCSDGTTSGEIRVVKEDGTTVLSDFFAGPWVGAVPVSSTAFVLRNPFLALDGAYNADITRHIQVRRTAGTGTLSLAIPTSIGG